MRDDRGLNEQIALVLMVAVAFVAAGAVLLSGVDLTSVLDEPAPQVEFDVAYDATDGVLVVTHQGGQTLDSDDGRVTLVVQPADGGVAQNYTWSDGGELGAGNSFSLNSTNSAASATMTYPGGFEAGDVLRVVWQPSDARRSFVLAQYRVPRTADPTVRLQPGVAYEYFEASSSYTSLPNFDSDVPTTVGSTDSFDISLRQRGSDYAFRFTGYIEVPEDGQYTFWTRSDDGSELFVDGNRVVENGGLHAPVSASGTVTLSSGLHEITVTQFEHTGGEVLDVAWAGPSFGKEPIPTGRLSHEPLLSASVDATCVGLTCSFDASGSTDADGSITGYQWDFGDGNTTTTSGPSVTHTYGSVGSRTATLTVVGSDGETAPASTTAEAAAIRGPDSPGAVEQGLDYEHYEGNWNSLPDFDTLTPTTTGETDNFDIFAAGQDGETFAYRYTGYVEVPEDGEYTFWTGSDDGSRLTIGDDVIVDNDGVHSYEEQSGTIDLAAGKHEITVTFFERTGQETLRVFWAGPSFGKERVPTSELSRNSTSPAVFGVDGSGGTLADTVDSQTVRIGLATITGSDRFWERGQVPDDAKPSLRPTNRPANDRYRLRDRRTRRLSRLRDGRW
ncbi:PA14 domain-containing protein [Haloarchaeobius sp. DFWS5]|uniref:PA14 domain-containing protein n=1 Tax=Haloarchaeobius sp. DFWS5 TaxID=3446114 RepID=UPI003EBD47EF